MNTSFNWIRRTSLALIAAAALGALAGCASAPQTPPDIAQRIESARTRVDHESLATYYGQEATKARDIAASHRKMAKSYQSMAYAARGSSMKRTAVHWSGPLTRSRCSTTAWPLHIEGWRHRPVLDGAAAAAP